MNGANLYLEEVHRVLPRVLALFDADRLSPTYGQGDRRRWAWRLSDFGNGSFQGAAHGLSLLWTSKLLPDSWESDAVFQRLDSMFQGARSLLRRNGSLEEAFPYESSFCVTAQVAFDLLSAIERTQGTIGSYNTGQWLEIIAPMIRFLGRSDECHGLISNHLGAAAAALIKWTELSSEEGEKKGRHFLDRVLKAQSPDGSFREYAGADPGYQTLCMLYMTEIERMKPEFGLLPALQRSIDFLSHFAHPDGSFGGHYGSRNTRLYFPAGIEALSGRLEMAASLASFMRVSIAQKCTVVLNAVDELNLIPLFNAYCLAAHFYRENTESEEYTPPPLPFQEAGEFRRSFPYAGIMVDKGPAHYTVVSFHKGGVCYHFDTETGRSIIDQGVAAESPSGALYSSQAYSPANFYRVFENRLVIKAPLTRLSHPILWPWQMLFIRLLNLTVLRWGVSREWFKKLVVRFLFSPGSRVPIVNVRTIRLGVDFAISDDWEGPFDGWRRLETGRHFSAVRMASQGYWQKQDNCRLVRNLEPVERDLPV